MPNVNIPAITIEYDGVVYATNWDTEGNISYKGIDKEGKEISEIPGAVVAKARSYGASFGSGENKEDTKQENGQEKGLEHFEIDTDGKGGWTLKSGDESKLTPKQREWCKEQARAAAQEGGNKNLSGAQKDGALLDSQSFENAQNSFRGFLKSREIKRLTVVKNSEGRYIEARGEGGRPIHLSSEDSEYILARMDALKLKHKEENRGSFKGLAKGFVQDITDLAKTPFQMARDVAKFGKKIAQGRFKEATGKAADKISENLKSMIGLGTVDEKKLYGIERFARRQKQKMADTVKVVGRGIKGLFDRLSGRSQKGEDFQKGELQPAIRASQMNPAALQKRDRGYSGK